MKITFLNVWDARVKDELSAYLRRYARNTDVFCLQEVYDDAKRLCQDILPDYTSFSDYKFVTKEDVFAQATYVHKSVKVISSGSILQEQEKCGLGLYVELQLDGRRLFVCNFHGMSRPVDKLDDPNRILQSETLISFFKDKQPAIIGGDFNLFPDTKSIRMFEEYGYSDLIKEHGIKTTRNQLAWDMYPDSKQYYSDYVFLNPEVRLKSFAVPDNKISDHLPLELDIESNP